MLYLNIFNVVLDYLRVKLQVFKNYSNKIRNIFFNTIYDQILDRNAVHK